MTNIELNYSELLYLHADKYVSEPGFLQNKEELPNGKKVQVVMLGNLLAEAAFAYLYLNNYINLELGSKKFLGIIPQKAVIATKKPANETNIKLTSLEKLIFELSDGLDVETILYRLIGDECAVPWSVIAGITKESLVNKSFFIKEEVTKKLIVSYTTYRYTVNPDINIDLSNKLTEMNTKMKEFSQKDFYKLLVKAINAGINSQKEQPDSD